MKCVLILIIIIIALEVIRMKHDELRTISCRPTRVLDVERSESLTHHAHITHTIDVQPTSGGARVLGARGQRYFWRPSPLKAARGLEGALKFPSGSGRSPAAKRILVHLRQIIYSFGCLLSN